MNNITSRSKICMVIGDPIEHSLSPQMHNAGYRALKIDDKYVYVACRVNTENITDFIKGIKAMQIRGVSCTIPHKQLVLPYLDEIDKTAKVIGAVNTIVNDNGKLKGYNTDWLGVFKPLQTITSVNNKRVALLGAGGAARAVIYAVKQTGGQVTIFNRTSEKAQKLADESGCIFLPFEQLEKVKNMDIIFNATPLGLHPHENETPIPKEYINSRQIVFDAVYNPYETRLLKEAKEKGAKIIHGIEMLLYQGTEQFKLFTGYDAPEEMMRSELMKSLLFSL